MRGDYIRKSRHAARLLVADDGCIACEPAEVPNNAKIHDPTDHPTVGKGSWGLASMVRMGIDVGLIRYQGCEETYRLDT